MRAKKALIGAGIVLIGLPALLLLIGAVYVVALNRTNGTIVSSGQEREFLLYVPRSYDRTKPTPLVISLHAGAQWPAAQMETSRWNHLADNEGFLVVYPAGGSGVLAKAWALTPDARRATEVKFISDLIDTLRATYNIDSTRIYANGLSLGGAMAFVLSCTLSHRIAAVGAAAGTQVLPWSSCADTTTVPMIAFHGTGDPLVPFDGGTSPTGLSSVVFPSVREWAANWARRNHCAPGAVESSVAHYVRRAEYTNCAANAGVVLYTIGGGGHTWPGAKPALSWIVGSTNTEIDATREMWTFFRDHPLARR